MTRDHTIKPAALAYMQAHAGTVMRAMEVAAATGKDPRLVTTALSRLALEGRISRFEGKQATYIYRLQDPVAAQAEGTEWRPGVGDAFECVGYSQDGRFLARDDSGALYEFRRF